MTQMIWLLFCNFGSDFLPLTWNGLFPTQSHLIGSDQNSVHSSISSRAEAMIEKYRVAGQVADCAKRKGNDQPVSDPPMHSTLGNDNRE